MPTKKLDEIEARGFDNVLRYQVDSESRAHSDHLVDLGSFDGNGECDCENFYFNLRVLLEKQISPERAVRDKLIKIKKGTRIADALRCKHILCARSKFADDIIRAMVKKERAEAERAKEEARARRRAEAEKAYAERRGYSWDDPDADETGI